MKKLLKLNAGKQLELFNTCLKWQRTFCIMDQRVYFSGKLKLSLSVGKKKMSLKLQQVSKIKPETKWANHEQVENSSGNAY